MPLTKGLIISCYSPFTSIPSSQIHPLPCNHVNVPQTSLVMSLPWLTWVSSLLPWPTEKIQMLNQSLHDWPLTYFSNLRAHFPPTKNSDLFSLPSLPMSKRGLFSKVQPQTLSQVKAFPDHPKHTPHYFPPKNLFKMAEQVNAVLASSHDHIKITTKLYNSQLGEPSED